MKNLLLLAFLPFALTSCGKYLQGKVVLEDGKTMKGQVKKLKNSFSKKVRYKSGDDGRVIKYNAGQVDKIIYYVGNKTYTFEYFKMYSSVKDGEYTNLSNRPIWHLELMDGYVSVYEAGFCDWKIKKDNRIRTSYQMLQRLYLKREDEQFSYLISRNMRDVGTMYVKRAMIYFEDCPRLIKRIKHEEITADELFRATDFYNQSCAGAGDENWKK